MAVSLIDSIDPVITRLGDVTSFSLDLETTGLNPFDSRILLCQIKAGEDIFVMDAARTNLSPLAPFLESYSWEKIIHNAKFESKFFKHFYGATIRGVWDAFLAEQIISPDGHQSGLDDVAKKYLNVEMDKTVRKSFIGKRVNLFTQEQLQYAATDVEVLPAIREQQLERIRQEGMEQVANLEFGLVPVTTEMELTGVPVDVPKWKERLSHYKELHEESRLRMNDLFFDSGKLDEQMGLFVRDGINLRSQQQLIKAFEKLGINLKKADRCGTSP